MMERRRNILVFRTGHLGDTVISLPSIRVIRERHPRHRLILLTEMEVGRAGHVSAWDILGQTGWFDDVVFFRPAAGVLEKIRVAVQLLKELRGLDADLIYDLAPERSLVQSRRDRFFFRRLAGVKEHRGGGYLVKPGVDGAGILQRVEPEWKRLLRAVGADAKEPVFDLPISKSDRDVVGNALEHAGVPEGGRLLAVGPGSRMPAKIWPLERFREVGRRLIEEYSDIHLIVLGGADDSWRGDDLCGAWGGRSHNLAGRLSIYGSAAVLEGCAAYVGNDSGSMHLAAAVGTPCVALFSARDYPGQWEPYGSGHTIFRHETECAGCMVDICPFGNRCINLISVDDVCRAAEAMLGVGIETGGGRARCTARDEEKARLCES